MGCREMLRKREREGGVRRERMREREREKKNRQRRDIYTEE